MADSGPQALAVKLDPTELAVRLFEAGFGCVRPEGRTAADAIASLPPDQQAVWERAALGALEYFTECLRAGQMESIDVEAQRAADNHVEVIDPLKPKDTTTH